MDAVVAWLGMGGYAGYVWPAYGVASLILGGLVLYACRRYRQSEAALARLERGSRE